MIINKIKNAIINKNTVNPISLDSCNIFQELDYQLYLKDPSLLDEYLCNHYEYDYPIKFFSFRKFFKLPQVIENYFFNMKKSFSSFSIEKNDIVIDIGAHHGIFTVNLANLGARVHSFEPNPMSLEIIKKNINVNSFANDPIINNCAVSNNENQSVNFDLGIRSTAGSIKNLKYTQLQSGQKIKVKTTNIDNYILNKNLDHIKLLKMDCEGAEYDIFQSSTKIYNIEYLIVEAHETSGNNPFDLIKNLKRNGYIVNKVKANYGAYELYCRKK